ncbi:hypothetical protein [Streptomyces sp. GSL17-111]|uniref:hypothetical protein n=1 Tax=Streptomyces sp. GSL17-111 TaxID=3121596 RepID=UPI0030F420E0
MTMEAVRIDFDKETGIGPVDREGPFDPAERRLMEDLQGNILKSHGRGHSRHLFIRFDPASRDRGRAWLAGMADRITTAMKQWDDSRRRAALFAAAGFGPLGVSVGLRLADGPRLTLDGTAGPLGGSLGAGLGDGGLFGASAGARTDRGGARPDSDGGHGGDGDGRLVDPEAFLSAELARNPSDVFVNLMLSASGYRALGFTRLPADEAFARGSRDSATLARLCDPRWSSGTGDSGRACTRW